MKQSLVMTKSPPWMNKNVKVFIKGKNVFYNSLLQKNSISVYLKSLKLYKPNCEI